MSHFSEEETDNGRDMLYPRSQAVWDSHWDLRTHVPVMIVSRLPGRPSSNREAGSATWPSPSSSLPEREVS